MIAASIFIASMVAMVCPASTWSPAPALTVTTPANGAPGVWSGLDRSAFSAVGMSLAMLRSRTTTGRGWPLRMHITVRVPRSSGVRDRFQPDQHGSTPRSSLHPVFFAVPQPVREELVG